MKNNQKLLVIYNKWLHVLGGGEWLTCCLAKYGISKNYRVILISKKKVTFKTLNRQFNLKLDKNIKFITTNNPQDTIRKTSSNADIFINISFFDNTKGYAKNNYHYIFFPDRYNKIFGYLPKFKFLNEISYKFFNSKIKPITFTIPPTNTYINKNHIVYEIGDKVSIKYSCKSKKLYKFSCYIYSKKNDANNEIQYLFDGCNVLQEKEVNFKTNLLEGKRKIFTLKTINNEINITIINGKANSNLLLIYPSIVGNDLYNNLINRILNRIAELLRIIGYNHSQLVYLRKLKIFSISKYTNNWITKYWNLKSIVLYPPIDLIYKKFKIPTKNYNYILSVGRFCPNMRSKNQIDMIKAFIEIYDKGFTKWQLHLSGSLQKRQTDETYFKYLKYLAKKYPIYFHTNISRQKLIKLYLKSKIYWHATGLNINNNKPYLREHFGITPIEAISADCIPLLHNSAGTKELVKLLQLNKKYHLFNTHKELIQKTLDFIRFSNKNNILTKQMKHLLENNFGYNTFYRKLDKLLL